MLRPRIIPCLLLRGSGLVKTVKFAKPRYVGDPINAVRIFNEKEVDEIVVLDIEATRRQSGPPFKLISEIAGECFMPLCYGGGIRTLGDIEKLISLGVEKVALNTAAAEDAGLVRSAAGKFGSQSIVVSIDAKRSLFGRYEVFTHGGRKNARVGVTDHAGRMQDAGAGEIFLNSVDRDGMMKGYDLHLIKQVTDSLGIPVIACGGAGCLDDFRRAIKDAGAAAAAAGSLFVFHGKYRAVLITYPTQTEIAGLLN